MNKCTLGKRHKWTFIKNITVSTQTLRTITLQLRGKYRCECGEVKIGTPGIEAVPA